MVEWKPTSTRSMLQHRCAVLTHARHFFLDRGLLEVDTPIVVNAPVTDVHIHSAKVQFADNPRPFFLHTSPEYAMKRLLAAGSGDIYQICHVVRGFERGRVHNAEFTLIEWYRIGYTLDQLMEEVETLVRTLLSDVAFSLTSQRLSYQEAFLRTDGFCQGRARRARESEPLTGSGRSRIHGCEGEGSHYRRASCNAANSFGV